MPINFLIFCKPLIIGNEVLLQTVQELQNAKSECEFALDIKEIKSMKEVRKILGIKDCVSLYDQVDNVQGRVYGGTQFSANEKMNFNVIFIIEISKDPKKCKLISLSSNNIFRDLIASNILDLIASFNK